MADVRENILARLVEVVATIPNIRSAHRNNVDITEDQKPAVVVLDGDEEANDAQNRRSNSPVMVQMTPGIVVFATPNMDGSSLSVMRLDLIKLVLFDTGLNNLVAKSSPRGDGTIRYLGCQTDVGWSRTEFVAMSAQFQFKYALQPEQL